MRKKNGIFFGDSITDANHLFTEHPLGEGYLKGLFDLSCSFGFPLFLCNQGHNGHTLEKLISVFHQTWNHGKSRNGMWDLVAVQIGINDVSVCQNTGISLSDQKRYLTDYQKNFSQLLEEIRRDFSGTLFLLEPFLFPCPAEFQNWMRLRERFSKIMEETGKSFQCTFLPLQSLLVESCSPSSFSLLTIDGIHLTETGNQLLADFIWSKLCTDWEINDSESPL